MQLIENWHKAYTYFTVQASVLLGVLLTVQQVLPMFTDNPALVLITSSALYSYLVAGLAFAIVVLRLIKQAPIEEAPPLMKVPAALAPLPPPPPTVVVLPTVVLPPADARPRPPNDDQRFPPV